MTVSGGKSAPEAGAPEAIEELAKILHWKQWHLDPDPNEDGPPAWPDLPEFDQNFFRKSVRELLSHQTLIRAALLL